MKNFKDMPALPIDIETLIPHRDRMKLIDDVLEANADKAITSSLVSDFCRSPCPHRACGADGGNSYKLEKRD
jgi:predicted hotdog family 3-hydroxylacyl-ACP dehydratase